MIRTYTKHDRMAIDEVVATVEQLFVEGIGGCDTDLIERVVTPDFTFRYPFPGFSPGSDGLKELAEGLQTAIPDLQVEINSLFGCIWGDEEEVSVSIRWTARGTHSGDFFGVAATDRYVSVSAIGQYTGGGGHGLPPDMRLRRGWLEMDSLGLFHQIGLVPEVSSLLPSLPDNR